MAALVGGESNLLGHVTVKQEKDKADGAERDEGRCWRPAPHLLLGQLGQVGEYLTAITLADDYAGRGGAVTRARRASKEGARFERIVRISIVIDEVSPEVETDIGQREVIVLGPPCIYCGSRCFPGRIGRHRL